MKLSITFLKRIIPYVFAVALVLFAANLSGEALGVRAFLTSKRIGLIVLAFFYILLLCVNRGKIVRFHKNNFLAIIIIMLLVFWGFLSTLFSRSPYGTSLTPIITWFLIGVMIFFIAQLSQIIKDNLLKFTNSIIYLGSVITIAIFIWLTSNIGINNFITSYIVRSTLGSFMDIGLNRLLNGLFVLNIYNIAVSIGVLKRKKRTTVMCLVAFIMLLILSFASGSRQTILAIIVFSVSLLFIHKSIRKKMFLSVKQIILLVLIGLLSTYVVTSLDLSNRFDERFIGKTISDIQSGDQMPRISLLKAGLYEMKESSVFGMGPGTFHKKYIYHPHNGYLGLGVEFGPPMLFVMCAYLIYLTIYTYRKKNTIKTSPSLEVYVVSHAFFITFAYISIIFNDLLNEQMFWMTVVLLNTTLEKTNL